MLSFRSEAIILIARASDRQQLARLGQQVPLIEIGRCLGEDGGVDVVRVADQEGARQEWAHATEQSRRLAIAADAELRCRHLGPRCRARHRTRGWKLTTADRAGVDAESAESALSAWESVPSGLSPSLICKAGCPPMTVRALSSPGLMTR